MQKKGIIATLILVSILAAGAVIFSRLSYKICWRCDSEGYFARGSEYACSEKESYRKAGLGFISTAAEEGHLQAELMLAELYTDELPDGYRRGEFKQNVCLRRDAAPERETGLSYFAAVSAAVAGGQEVDVTTLLNLALLYRENVLSADDQQAAARVLYEKAAAAGNFSAMRTLGLLLHEQGDYPGAVNWLTKAAEDLTDYESPMVLGEYYLYGRGTAVDLAAARKWFNLALERAAKISAKDRAARKAATNILPIRLDIVERKIQAAGGDKPKVAVGYYLEGGVTRFEVFSSDIPEKSLGTVINDKGNIRAVISENQDFFAGIEESQRGEFSSMISGVKWILGCFAKSAHEHPENFIFDFVLRAHPE